MPLPMVETIESTIFMLQYFEGFQKDPMQKEAHLGLNKYFSISHFLWFSKKFILLNTKKLKYR
jgi:hypothetical protein